MTDFEKSEKLRVANPTEPSPWRDIIGKLDSSFDCGFLVFVADGYVEALEGFGYDDGWPESIGKIELYPFGTGPFKYSQKQ